MLALRLKAAASKLRVAPVDSVAMEKLKLTWKDADAKIDWVQPLCSLPTRPRGDTDPSGAHILTAEFASLMSKGAYLLAGGTAPESDEVVDSLPSWEEHIAMTNARYARPRIVRWTVAF